MAREGVRWHGGRQAATASGGGEEIAAFNTGFFHHLL
jgi:hypothetical protein